MMANLSRAAIASAAFLSLTLQAPAPTRAEDRLIWQPVRTAKNGMRLRMGVKLPLRAEVSAGADLGVSASRSGRVEDAPLDVWARMAESRGEKTAVVTRRAIAGLFDPRSGAGSLDMSLERKRILTDRLDIERSRGVTLSCNAHDKACNDVTLRQNARLSATATGTALVAEGRYSTATLDFTDVVRLEQKVTTHMNVSAAVTGPFDADRQASLSLSYAFNW